MRHRYAIEPGTRALLTDMGLSTTAVLRRAGLRTDLLAGGPVWLEQADFFALWRAVEVEADHPHLPLLIEQSLSPDIFAPTLFAAVMSADLNTAARRISQYKRLNGPLHVAVDITSTETTIGLVWPADTRPPMTLALTELLFWVSIARLGTRAAIQPLRMCAQQTPTDVDVYREVVGVEIEESDTNRVSFSAADAAQPFLTANESIWQVFEPELRRRLTDLEADAPPSERVRAALLELLPVGRSTVAAVASELAVSSRTLHRQLQAEGTGFQHILNHTRESLARHYLSDPNLSATDIAFLIGYEEPSSFYRAFHTWTGATPEQVRSAIAGR
ncbi:MAG: AraC family transcriptional regulator ligand-binding domain-containing protein [Actinomycetota bacterium]